MDLFSIAMAMMMLTFVLVILQAFAMMYFKRIRFLLGLVCVASSGVTAYLFALAGLPLALAIAIGTTFLLTFLAFAPMFWKNKP